MSITLESMRKEVGEHTYNMWHAQAERDLSDHPALWGHSDARQACIYESMLRQYTGYRNALRQDSLAAVHASDNPLLWEGE